ncbi:MAG: DNA gyrase C-terminal beta-propeller domain-containing protein, partial [Planctomycetota bacterium]
PAEEQQRNLLTVTEGGYGKRTPVGEYLVHAEDGSFRTQSRGGKGRRDMKTTKGQVVSIKLLQPGDDLMLITHDGMIVRIAADSVRQTGRNTQGVRVVNLKGGDTLVAIARVADADDGSDDAADAEDTGQAG